MTLGELYNHCKLILKDSSANNVEDSEIKIILDIFLGVKTKDLILNKEKKLNQEEFQKVLNAISLRLKHIPLQYIIGNWEFMGLKLEVGQGVLIPREDTSVIVNEIISNFKNKSDIKIIDLCSGSGCIALALEKNLNKNSIIYALEKSDTAYEFLCRNLDKHNSNIIPMKKNVLTDFKEFEDSFFDCIVSNPPYIKNEELPLLQKEVLFEPKMALDGGRDGIYFYKNICKLWNSKLKPGGMIAFEIGKGQFYNVKKIMLNQGFESITFKEDINGIKRAIMGIKSF